MADDVKIIYWLKGPSARVKFESRFGKYFESFLNQTFSTKIKCLLVMLLWRISKKVRNTGKALEIAEWHTGKLRKYLKNPGKTETIF